MEDSGRSVLSEYSHANKNTNIYNKCILPDGSSPGS